MVEKIIVSPDSIRGMGNIVSPHILSDYTVSDCGISSGTDTVNGVSNTVYSLHSYLVNDDASSDNKSTLFSTGVALRNSGTQSVTYNSNGYYVITNTKSQAESFVPLTALTGKTSFIVEFDAYCEQVGGSIGFVIYKDSDNWEKLTDDCDNNKKYWEAYKRSGTFTENAEYYTSYNSVTNQKWLHHQYTINGTSFTMKVTDSEDTVIIDHTLTIPSTVLGADTKYGLDVEWQNNTSTRYKNIKAW